MIHKELLIVNRLGLHARAAAKFVSTASRFVSSAMVVSLPVRREQEHGIPL